jgi:hypothetical protein
MLQNGEIASTGCGTDGDSSANEAAPSDHSLTTEHLSALAFKGQAAFLLRCAAATDLSDNRPVVPNQRRASRYVYFIGAENGPVKIGVARVPYERLFTLQTAHHEELFIYAITPGGKWEEQKLHRDFAEYRLRGEWFERSRALLLHIISLQRAERARFATQPG